MSQEVTRKIVIVGGGYAGMMAALRLGRRARKHGAHIALVSSSDRFVERIRLHQVAAAERRVSRPLASLLRGTGVEFVQGNITALLPERHSVHLEGESGALELSYDYLIYAPGSATQLERTPGVAEHALSLDPGRTEAVHAALEALPDSGQVVVVGGGLTGIEAAAEFAQRWPRLRIELVTDGLIGYGLSQRGRDYLLQHFLKRGVAVRQHTVIDRLEQGRVLGATGELIPFDLCLWAGSFAAPDLAQRAGLATDARGRLLVDATLRSVSHAAVIGAGDAAAVGTTVGATLRMGCVTAMPMGSHAADVVLALLQRREPEPFRFGFAIQCLSLGRGDGLVQFVEPDDTPKDRVITGRVAAITKEFICRYTVAAMRIERLLPGSYRWPHGTAAPAADLKAAQGIR